MVARYNKLGSTVFVFVLTLAVVRHPDQVALAAQNSAAPVASAPAAAQGAGQAQGAQEAPAAPKARVVETKGPIDVEAPVEDSAIERSLIELLPKYPGVRSIKISVDHGIVTLDGRVDSDQTLDDLTTFVERVKGVRWVVNRMHTDEESMSAWDHAVNELGYYRELLAKKWVLALIAVVMIVVFMGLSRLVDAGADRLLQPFIKNVMMRSVIGTLLSACTIFIGFALALSLLNLTHVVLSMVGLAGVVGLAVGFAFRDIGENFIASVLLGMRHPFKVGDFIQVAGQSGVVRSLNTRATELVTLEGNHVRIPNSTVFKEILVNSTALPSVQGTFDVLAPYTASTACAIESSTEALRTQEAILPNPPARVLVEALEPGGVRLRAYYWVDARGVDRFQVASDARLRVKVALQQCGALPGAPTAAPAPAPAQAAGASDTDGSTQAQAANAQAQAQENLKRDVEAAAEAGSVPDGTQGPTPIEHAIHQANVGSPCEGANILVNSK